MLDENTKKQLMELIGLFADIESEGQVIVNLSKQLESYKDLETFSKVAKNVCVESSSELTKKAARLIELSGKLKVFGANLP